MPLVAAFCCLMLAFVNGNVFEETHTDTAYLVTNLYLMAGLILAGLVKGLKREPRKSKNEPTGSGTVSPGTEGKSPEDEPPASR